MTFVLYQLRIVLVMSVLELLIIIIILRTVFVYIYSLLLVKYDDCVLPLFSVIFHFLQISDNCLMAVLRPLTIKLVD